MRDQIVAHPKKSVPVVFAIKCGKIWLEEPVLPVLPVLPVEAAPGKPHLQVLGRRGG